MSTQEEIGFRTQRDRLAFDETRMVYSQLKERLKKKLKERLTEFVSTEARRRVHVVVAA